MGSSNTGVLPESVPPLGERELLQFSPRADREQAFSFYVGLFGGDPTPVAPCPRPVEIPNLTWTYSYQTPSPSPHAAPTGAGPETALHPDRRNEV